MKSIFSLATLLLVPTLSFAEGDTINRGKVSVAVHELVCVTNVSGQTYTQVSAQPNLIFRVNPAKAIALKHSVARGEGCDLTKLQRLATKAGHSFGYLQDLPATITQKRQTYQNRAGQCVTLLMEGIELNLGEGVVVQSSEVGETIAPCR